MNTHATLPVPRSLLLRLWFGLAAAGLFMAVATVQGAMRPGYNAWHQAISALSLGSGGWVQQVNFVIFGAALVGTAPAWRRLLAGGTGASAYPILIAATGLSFIVASVVRQDPAPGYDPEGLSLERRTTLGIIHLAIAGVAAASSVIALLVMAQRFAGDPVWRGWSAYSRSMALVTVLCVVVYGVWSTRATGFAGTFERAAILLPVVWAFTFLRRLWAGRPFMVAGAASPPTRRR